MACATFSDLFRSRGGHTVSCFVQDRFQNTQVRRVGNIPFKDTGGSRDTHTGHKRGTRAHTGTRITQTNLTTKNHPNPPNTQPARQRDDRNRGRLNTQQPQPRSRPLPAADSEEAAPSEPDPAATRSQGASSHWAPPRACRLLESSRRNEGARGGRVAAGGAARAPDRR